MVASAQGMDVSDYQGKYDWAGTAGLSFGICRATQGLGGAGLSSPDPYLAWNWAQIKAKGLHRGAYHFLDPGLSGQAQARYFVTEMDKLGLSGTDMLWLDNETAGAPASVAACAVDFMTELDTLAPHHPRGSYCNISFANEGYCAGLGRYPLWLAWPGAIAPFTPSPWMKWTFWQWGTRNGVDTDAFNGTAADLDAWIDSYAPKAAAGSGPHRQTVPYQGLSTLAAIAAKRGTTVAHLFSLTAAFLTPADTDLLGKIPLPPGTPFYTSVP